MVQGLNRAGLRVVMDVVYNHTPRPGQDPKSILDRIVPGYYHRLNPPTGQVETSTCCANTATEHAHDGEAHGRLGGDLGARVQGRRLPLRPDGPPLEGQHAQRAAGAGLAHARRDGVDGRKIYVYGEGWNFGEVANNARFVQATQLNMAGTGIGTFNDRLRDAVRGGGPFDEDPRIQGFATGLFTDPNGDPVNGTPEQQRARLLLTRTRSRSG